MSRSVPVVLTLLALCPAAWGDVVWVEIHRREPFAGGLSFGETGPYERISGVVRFAVDPAHPRNRAIVDLDLAPRNAQGKVEFEADFFILAPREPAKGNGALFFEVNNRGLKLALRAFSGAPQGNDPSTEADAGDGYFFRRGYTLAWCGWIGELLPGDGRLLLKPPVASEGGRPIRGVARYEMVTNAPAESLPLARREGIGSYPPTKRGEEEGVLTWRLREKDPRAPVPRANWSLERMPLVGIERGIAASLPQVRLRLKGGFQPGAIYELVCEVEGPIVQGTGYLAVRDLVSFLRYGDGRTLPRPAFTRAHAFGISQSGRFLRNFLYLDLNEDESGRKVFDGLMPHVAGGGLGFFNHRFGQASRYNAQHEEHLYPCDRFPFAYGDARDPFSGRVDGILRPCREREPRNLPKILHTQHSAEYWHRSGSLVHTDPEGRRDVEIPDNVRVYAFGGIQHGPTHNPVAAADNPPNPADSRPFLKALLDALDAWVRDGTAPPPSVYPRIDQGALVLPDLKSVGFPALPGVRFPGVIQRPHALDHGPEFETRGRMSIEPPRLLGDYVVRVPRSDADGNDAGTLLVPEVAVPLATYTGWNLRGREAGAEGELAELMGSRMPFARTRREREASGDPRASLEERYAGFEEYRRRFVAECARLEGLRFLLSEDTERLSKALEESRPLFIASPK
jgi:hypothetical protein